MLNITMDAFINITSTQYIQGAFIFDCVLLNTQLDIVLSGGLTRFLHGKLIGMSASQNIGVYKQRIDYLLQIDITATSFKNRTNKNIYDVIFQIHKLILTIAFDKTFEYVNKVPAFNSIHENNENTYTLQLKYVNIDAYIFINNAFFQLPKCNFEMLYVVIYY